jgi:tRNA nucleotidyltransferase (CCA-adding enzyme)
LKFLEKINLIKISPIIKEIVSAGGIPYLVGGSVRDFVLKQETKDLDIEVHKISLENLEKILKKFGTVSLVGKKFGVLKLHGYDIDWSLPRRDTKGRKPEVIVDPEMTIKDACLRRDITMNAMAIDLSSLNGEPEIIDHFGGLEDIKNKVLRVVDKKLFIEDPLRFYRVMQFVGRFEMKPDDELNDICKKMDLRDVTLGGELARERIYEEIKKLLLKSKRPSLGFRWLKEIGRLKELFPEVGDLVGVEQRADYHPEGDVFEHTMQSLDASAKISEAPSPPFVPSARRVYRGKAFTIMLALLCHDFGKVISTDEKLTAKGHDIAGVPLAKKFLKRFTWNSSLISAVCKLVRYHRMPLELVEQGAKPKAYKRLALKLAPEVTANDLYFVSWADIRGRNSKGELPLEIGFKGEDEILDQFLENVQDASVEHGPEKPVLQGRDLLGIVEPGPEMGAILKKAYEIQIDEGITDREELKKRVLPEK